MCWKLPLLCLVCVTMITFAFGQGVYNVTCTPPVINTNNWTVSATCDGVLYGEAGQGDCNWKMYEMDTNKLLENIRISHQAEPLTDGDYLWKCSLHHQFTCEYGSFDVYVQFYFPTTKEQHAFSVMCDPPTLEVSCPASIKEGDPLNCTCRVSNKPTPCPVLSWDDARDTRTACEGETQSFHMDHVQRAQHGQQHVCKARWGNTTIRKSYTLDVAYGPDQVTIDEVVRKNETILLRCTASDFFPTVIFAWNVHCVNTTTTANNSECLLELDKQTHGRGVQCTASNNNTQVSLSHTYTVYTTEDAITTTRIDHKEDENAKEEKDNGVPILYIAIGAGGGAVVVFLCIVAVCIVRRKRKGPETVKFRGGVIRQSTKPTAVAARIPASPAGSNDAFIYDDDDEVSSAEALKAQSAIMSVLAKRRTDVTDPVPSQVKDNGVSVKPELSRVQKQHSVPPPPQGDGPPKYEEIVTRL